MIVTVIVPGRIETRTGGYIYDRRIAAGLRARGWTVEIREIDDSFPHPTAAALAEAGRVLAAIPDGSTVVIDGLAFGAMPAQAEREAARLHLVALVHAPLAAEAGLDADTRARLEAGETRALAAASLAVVTGSSTIAELKRYGGQCDRIVLIEPGTDRVPLARGSRGAPLQLLSVAALTPGKGHEILFRALAVLPHRDWHLSCAGSLDRHPQTVERLRSQLHADALEDHVSLVGELDDTGLADAYDRADLFVLATWHETYGMAVAEALAHGLPVVSTTTGAIPDLVGDAAGVLVAPGDVRALAAALTRVLGDAGLRERLRDGARRVRDRLPTWDDAATRMAAALKQVVTDGRVAR
jgi:glycosyltransferase involved in cell wall biosynthesis